MTRHTVAGARAVRAQILAPRNLPFIIDIRAVFQRVCIAYLRQLWRPRVISVLMSDSFFWIN